MAYTSGTAANYKDLLAVLATFAAANGWAVLEQSETKLYLRGEGLAGLDEIYCGIETYEDPANGYYNWELFGSWAYRAGRAFHAMPMSSGDDKAFVYLWNAAIPYWIVATPRRIILVAKISTTYQHMHLGLLNPPATDAQYPYPLLIAGTGSVKARGYSSLSNSAYWNANIYAVFCGRICIPGGTWKNYGYFNADCCGAFSPNYALRDTIIKSISDEYLLDPFYVTHQATTNNLGQIEGICRVSGYQNSAENIITVGGVNYMVFPDCHRSAYADYCALRLN
ncbi:MAG TPA: hypothetical protein DDY20_05810 [Desulfobulbaceae bacterium]|nr:hypothetical protein [Desulfobulbaceae bacterium]